MSNKNIEILEKIVERLIIAHSLTTILALQEKIPHSPELEAVKEELLKEARKDLHNMILEMCEEEGYEAEAAPGVSFKAFLNVLENDNL